MKKKPSPLRTNWAKLKDYTMPGPINPTGVGILEKVEKTVNRIEKKVDKLIKKPKKTKKKK